ncbi:hypothetical protein WA026_012905 [Henosepilachna vigintioctopunctata]|uniref:Uncharacterized protein n=1 Tax=Henosepilachna vigintioctopunctata TaxID=420089 RepID=A0AAW1TUX3_9CUCU
MSKHIDKLCRRTLNLEMKLCYLDIRKISQTIRQTKSFIKEKIPKNIFEEFSIRSNRSYEKRYKKLKESLQKKFNNLKFQTRHQTKGCENNNWFKNISKTIIPDDISKFLSLGPKFGIGPFGRLINMGRYLADVEDIIADQPEETKDY